MNVKFILTSDQFLTLHHRSLRQPLILVIFITGAKYEVSVKFDMRPTSAHCTKNVLINNLKTKRRPLYLKTQSVPRCKRFSSRL